MAQVWFNQFEAQSGRMPGVCMQCGGPAALVQRQFSWVSPGVRAGTGMLGLAGLPMMRALKCGDALSAIADYLGRCRDLGCLPELVLLDAAMPGAHRRAMELDGIRCEAKRA